MRALLAGIFGTLLLFFALLPARGHAQSDGPAGDGRAARVQEAPADGRVGLALSGGGAKGFAHIGVLQVLDSLGVDVGAVAGTSMGSIVGSLYATGYPPDSLAAIARRERWSRVFADGSNRRDLPLDQRVDRTQFLLTVPLRDGTVRLPTGLVQGQRISMLLSRLLLPAHGVRDFTRLPVPFAAVATDLATGEGVRFTRGFLPDVVRASIAIPSLFTPATINGRSFIDGGVARNLPAEDVRALGADVVLCSETSGSLEPADSLRNFVDILFQSVGYRMVESTADQIDRCDVVIEPNLEGVSAFDFDRAAALIRRGRRAARGAEADLRAALPGLPPAKPDSAAPAPRPPPDTSLRPFLRPVPTIGTEGAGATSPAPLRTPPPLRQGRDSLCIDSVRVQAATPRLQRRARAALSLAGPTCLSLDRIEAKVRRVYGLGAFDRVTYRMLPPAGPETAGAAGADGADGTQPDSARTGNARTRSARSNDGRDRAGRPGGVFVLRAEGREDGHLGLGIRYDTPYRASVLVGATLPVRSGPDGRLQLQARLGEVLRLDARYGVSLSFRPRTGVSAGVTAMQTPIDIYDNGRRLTQVRSEWIRSSLRAGVVATHDFGLAVDGGLELYRTDRSFGTDSTGAFVPSLTAFDEELVTADVRAYYDTLPTAAYPRSGVRVALRARFAEALGTGATRLGQYVLRSTGRVPVTSWLSLRGGLTAGTTVGRDVPVHRRLFLGGPDTFGSLPDQQYPLVGYQVQELSGHHVVAVEGGLRIGLPANLVAVPRWNAGLARERWEGGPSAGEVRTGWGLTVGRPTLFGPVELTLMGEDLGGPFRLQVSAGFAL